MSANKHTPVDSQAVRFLLQDAKTQRRYEREDRKFGRGVMVNSAPSPRYVLRTIQRDLLRIRRSRAAITKATGSGS